MTRCIQKSIILLNVFAMTAATQPGDTSDTMLMNSNIAALYVDAQLTQEAIAYYNKLLNPMPDLQKASYEYLLAVTKMRRARAVEKKRQVLLKDIDSMQAYYGRCEQFHNDTIFKSGLSRYLDLVYKVLKQDFDKILDMEDIKEQTYDQAEAHQLAIDMASDKIQSRFKELKQIEKAFLKRYNITPNEEKSELTLKIEQANRTLEYYDSVNRIVSKANRQYSYAMDALNKKDVVGLEQHAATLESVAREGRDILNKKQGFEGDDDLVKTATAMLKLFSIDAPSAFRGNVDYFIKADNFLELQKKFNATMENERTKEIVDAYNAAVNQYNKGITEINKFNHDTFDRIKRLIDQWNKKTEAFFKKHS